MEPYSWLSLLTCLTCTVKAMGKVKDARRQYVEVDMGRGKLRGYREEVLGKTVDIFLGIPYAKPPVGQRRFMRPESLPPWNHTRNATEFPNSCYQMVDTAFNQFEGVDMWNPNTNMSEDCLYLNIWSPAMTEGSELKAVMTWIFGGGFYGGTSTLELYDGRIMAATSDVVVVSMQYRVGVLGFAYLGIGDAPGNQGLLDQQLALEWLFNNIARFGGDKHRVTLFGESSGAVSANFHLLSPLSRKYVQYVILESSSALSTWGVDSQKVAKKRTLDTAGLVGCPTAPITEVLKCLKKADPQELSNEMWNIDDKSDILTPVSPTIDGYFLEHHPREYLRRGDWKKTNVLLGTTKDEGEFFLPYRLPKLFPLILPNTSLTEEEFHRGIQRITYTDSDLLTELVAFEYGIPYTYSNTSKYRDALDDVLGDLAFVCPVVDFAEMAKKAGSDVFLYQFRHRTTANPWPAWMGVLHGYEIDHVFGLPLNATLNYTEEEKILSRKMLRYWTNFAKTG